MKHLDTRSKRIRWQPMLLAGLLLAVGHTTPAAEFRTIDGSNNNPLNTNWGQAETPLTRIRDVIADPLPGFDAALLAPSYQDTIDAPRSATASDPATLLPSPRDISNVVSAQGSYTIVNRMRASDWLWQWGQFLDHDLGLEGAGPTPTPMMIPLGSVDVATGGPDPLYNSDFPFIPFTRSGAAAGTGSGTGTPREQVNSITSYIDASQVYGSDPQRASFLRSDDGSGRLKTTVAANGEVLLPMNRAVDPLPNANPPRAPGVPALPDDQLFVAGDVRANEQVGLTAAHTLFVREHNYQVDRIAAENTPAQLEQKATDSGFIDGLGNPDVGEYLYQAARKIVGAEMQVITYEHFLPMLLGPNPLPAYGDYKDNVNPALSNEFATAAYRVGHTLLTSEVLSIGYDGTAYAPLALRDSFFNPQYAIDHGVDAILMGLSAQMAQEVDPMVIDDVRNFLFAESHGGLDLAAVNIQRGRDHGLPSYNDTREGLGLTRRSSFDEITSESFVAERLASIYGSVDDVDLWIGALAEDDYNDGLVGELLYVILADQFVRSRDGDRFFYLNDPYLLELYPDIANTTLAEIILRNTGMNSMPANVFLVAVAVPEPRSAALLLLLGAAPFLLTRRIHADRT